MNNTIYYNESNYIEINVSLPYCTGQGLSCPYLYNKRHVIAYFTTVGNIIIIPFILYLIFMKVKDGFFKYFTLNLMIVCVTSAIAASIIDAINVAKLFISITESKLHLFEIREWMRFYVRLGSIWFHALTLYAVIICYLPYVKPFFYTKKFSNRSQKPYYVALHTSVLIWSTSVTYLFTESIYRIPYFLTHITLFISLFIAALIGSFKISKYKPLGVDSIRVAKAQQKRLYSFILYSYSIEFITLPMFVSHNFRCDRSLLSPLLFLPLSHIAMQLFHCLVEGNGLRK
ncbi:putative integral membrane protein [Brugia pahangi]